VIVALLKVGYMLENDNPIAADNQQDRLIKIGWVTGFVDGEGCFSINFIRQPHRHNRRGYKTGIQVAHEFVVTQSAKSLGCLHLLMEFFGVGDVYVNRRYDNHKEHVHRYCVRKRSDLVQTVIPFFKEFPLRTSKQADFLKFAECLRLMDTNTHLTRDGLAEMVEIAETMNHCRPRTEIIRILRDHLPEPQTGA
jgi:hypothetical protein